VSARAALRGAQSGCATQILAGRPRRPDVIAGPHGCASSGSFLVLNDSRRAGPGALRRMAAEMLRSGGQDTFGAVPRRPPRLAVTGSRAQRAWACTTVGCSCAGARQEAGVAADDKQVGAELAGNGHSHHSGVAY
jgi:hypothetical protein